MADSKGHCQTVAPVIMVASESDLIAPSVKVIVANQPSGPSPSYQPFLLLNHPYQAHRSFTNSDSASAIVDSIAATAVVASSFTTVIAITITSSSAFISSFIAIASSTILIVFSSFILVSQTQIHLKSPCR